MKYIYKPVWLSHLTLCFEIPKEMLALYMLLEEAGHLMLQPESSGISLPQGSRVHLPAGQLTRLVLPGGLDGKESARKVTDSGLIPGSGRSSGEGHGNPI
ncbi:unnamed protein product [Rangifer tarandus platyrhynchus]|uniref:Uncharacterized protein n=2 Tax=Rangifer tarandus platyrhynchus TaxID=3082113 RepID=A0ABN8Z150_RANTA|nr:unnamed protein product [Rangifer tarandus platyrhynchus]